MNEPPEWISQLADDVSAQLLAVDVLSPVACHFHRAEDEWEITLFASHTEVLGGPLDGLLKSSRFHFDIRPVLDLFDVVDSIYWQAQSLGDGDDLGPHLGIEGLYQGEQVWLRVLASPPQQFPPGRRALAHQGDWEDLW